MLGAQIIFEYHNKCHCKSQNHSIVKVTSSDPNNLWNMKTKDVLKMSSLLRSMFIISMIILIVH